jgi:hypothetical protein
MHRAICGLVKGDGKEVDHWNGAPLDNRRANLKVVTRALNSQNLAKRKDAKHSRFCGVGRNLRTGKWTASVRVNGQRFHAGTFETEEDAAAAASELRRSVFSNSNEARNVKTRKRSRVAY